MWSRALSTGTTRRDSQVVVLTKRHPSRGWSEQTGLQSPDRRRGSPAGRGTRTETMFGPASNQARSRVPRRRAPAGGSARRSGSSEGTLRESRPGADQVAAHQVDLPRLSRALVLARAVLVTNDGTPVSTTEFPRCRRLSRFSGRRQVESISPWTLSIQFE